MWNTGLYLNQALELEPEGFFTETILYRFDSGFQLDFESNYRLSKEEQEKVEYYDERESGSDYYKYFCSWRCYYDNEENQTFDKKLIDIIDKEQEDLEEEGYDMDSPNGVSLHRLDPSDFLKNLDYYWF